MDSTMVTAFIDELQKIADNAIAAPATITTGSKPKSSMNPENKATSYTTIKTEVPKADFGAAAGIKAAPPPPVRT